MSAVSNIFPSAQVIERALFLNPAVSGRITQQNIRAVAETLANEKISSFEDLAIKVSQISLRQRSLTRINSVKLLSLEDCKILAAALEKLPKFCFIG